MIPRPKLQVPCPLLLSLVAFYGAKPTPLRQLITEIQDYLSQRLSKAFHPYEMAQVHGTIIGLEATRIGDELYSRWYTVNKGESKPIDLPGLLFYLQNGLPEIQIRIGGYQARKDYGFTSRGELPFVRSFSFQGAVAVGIGWPVRGQVPGVSHTEKLVTLRQSFDSFHLCHKWHKDGYRDNDFFLVFGKINHSAVAPEILEQTAEKVRRMLAEMETIFLISPENLSVVAYSDPELPLDSTQIFPLDGKMLSIFNRKN